MTSNSGLRALFLQAVVAVAGRHPDLRGPYRFDEAELQLMARNARRLLAAAALQVEDAKTREMSSKSTD